MNKPTLDSIASAKAKLAEELRNLEEQETQLRQQATADAFAEVMNLLGQYGSHFTAKQKAEIVAAAGAGDSSKPAKAKKTAASKEIAPKYWLPHSGETWSGRGRPPRAFAAYEGSVAHKEWKAKHPDERFPRFPG